MKALNGIAVSAALAGGLVVAAPVQADVVKIDGSSTVFPVTEAVAEDFQKSTKGKYRVTVGISGTGGGFKKFSRGEIDISDASRPILKKEMDACREAGIRYIELRDRLNIATYKINAQGGTNISDATVGTYNWLLGTQFGVRTGFTYDIFTVSVFGKAGLFFNNGNAQMLVRPHPPFLGGKRRVVEEAQGFGMRLGLDTFEARATDHHVAAMLAHVGPYALPEQLERRRGGGFRDRGGFAQNQAA